MDSIRYLYDEILAREEERANLPDILEQSFDLQRNFIKHKATQKALFCTRRSSKSYTGGLYLTHDALKYEGCNFLFIGLTRQTAWDIIYKDILLNISNRYELGMDPNSSKYTCTYPNGSIIYVTGVDVDEEEMNKLLGRKYKLVIIDEASMYTVNISNLVYGVLGPAITDLNGTICLMGTASNFPRGLFFDVTTKKERGWSLFQWTAHDNPFVAKQWGQILEKIRIERPEYMETPQYKQWYLNQWVIDQTKLVYKFTMEKNLVKYLPNLPDSGWTYILGCDTGWRDASTFVLMGFHVNDPHLYVIRSKREKGITFDQFAEIIVKEFQGQPRAPHKIIIDGANKQGVESMRLRYHIPFVYADKQDKVTFIDLCNADLVQGKIKIVDTPENRPLWEEMSSLVWATIGDEVKLPKKEHPNLPNDLCDAFLYGWRSGYHFNSTPAKKVIIQGSKEWYEQQSDRIWEREKENIQRSYAATDNDWGEMGSLGDLESF